jgi:Ala-tRNA(Pro) deacylase
MADGEAYEILIGRLKEARAHFSELHHAPEGRTELVSAMRGHAPSQAAKCMILMAKVGRKQTRFLLAVIPGDTRVDIEAIKRVTGATFVRFAEQAVAETLARSAAGTVLPFPMDNRVELIVDPALASLETIYFNAGRLDRSVALKTSDYIKIARPRLETISCGA